VLKFGELSFQDNIEAYLVTRGKRLLGSLGLLRGFDFDDECLLDDLRDDGTEFLDVLLTWDGEGYQVSDTRGDVVWLGEPEPRYRVYPDSAGALQVVHNADGSARIDDGTYAIDEELSGAFTSAAMVDAGVCEMTARSSAGGRRNV